MSMTKWRQAVLLLGMALAVTAWPTHALASPADRPTASAPT